MARTESVLLIFMLVSMLAARGAPRVPHTAARLGRDSAASPPVLTEGNGHTPAPSTSSSKMSPPQIAFVRDGDIYLFAGAAAVESRLTDDARNDAPRWTSDGENLLFTKIVDGEEQIWHWQPGSEPVRVHSGTWAPNGESVAFGVPTEDNESTARTVQQGPWGPPQAVWVEAQGKRQQLSPAEPGIRWRPLAWATDSQRLALARLEIPPPELQVKGSLVPVAQAQLWIADGRSGVWTMRQLRMPRLHEDSAGTPDVAAWSPDSRFLTVGVGAAIPCNSCRVDGARFFAVPVDGGEPLDLDSALTAAGAIGWSPRGSFVVLSAPGGRITYDHKWLRRFDKASGTSSDLSHDPQWADIEPVVAPDGVHIAFARGATPENPMIQQLTDNPARSFAALVATRRIWLMDADSGQARQLTDAPGWADEAPRWSPDGEWIIFVRWHGDNAAGPATADLWAVRADGTELRRLTALGPTRGMPQGTGYYGQLGWDRLFAVAPG